MLLVRARNLAVPTFGILLAVSLTVSPAYAGAIASNTLPPDMVRSSGMDVADGTVTSANGIAMGGVAVDLYAWPSDAVQQAMNPGQRVPTTLLATATTSKAGRYMLRVPAAQLKAAAVESGYANLEIFSAVGGFWFFSYQTGSLPTRPSAPVTVNLGGKKKRPSCGLNPRHRPYSFTGFKLERHRPRAWAVVGQGYIIHQKKTAGDSVSFKYTKGLSQSQTSALGLGISGYGFDAGYNTAGTHTSTASRSEGYATQTKSTLFRTEFNTGQFRGICYGPANDSNIPYQHQKGQCPHSFKGGFGVTFYVHKCFWLIKSTGWAGGQSKLHPARAPRTSARFCLHHDPKDSFGGDFGTAIQWSAGFELGAALGVKGVNLKASFNGSAQTGYDTDAFMQFTFGPRFGGYLCGTNGTEATAALLVQRNNKP